MKQLPDVLWQLGFQVLEFCGAHRLAQGGQYRAGSLSGPLVIHSRARPYLIEELHEIEPFGAMAASIADTPSAITHGGSIASRAVLPAV
jgi:hypothetical protein